MLTHEGDARTKSADRVLAWSLAGGAGMVNAVGFYAGGRYISHMTGTFSMLGEEAWLADAGGIALSVAIVAAFVAGAAISAILISLGRRRGLRGIHADSVIAEGGLLARLFPPRAVAVLALKEAYSSGGGLDPDARGLRRAGHGRLLDAGGRVHAVKVHGDVLDA